MRIKSANPDRRIDVLDTVYGVEAKRAGDWVEIGANAHPNLQDWLRSDWPELLVLDHLPIDPKEFELLRPTIGPDASTPGQ